MNFRGEIMNNKFALGIAAASLGFALASPAALAQSARGVRVVAVAAPAVAATANSRSVAAVVTTPQPVFTPIRLPYPIYLYPRYPISRR